MNLTLVRHAYLPDVTLGRLYAGDLVLATLEEPWIPDPDGPGGQRRQGNLRESCVPDGVYVLRPHVSARYPREPRRYAWRLENPTLGVYPPGQRPPGQPWGREAILIHIGNTVLDIEGCIVVGLRHGQIDGLPAVLMSGDAINRLYAVLGDAEHRLTIRPIAGTSEKVA